MAATGWVMGPQTAEPFLTCQPVCGNGRGLLGKASAFICPWRIVFPSLVFVPSPSRCFRSCTFWLEIHLITVLSIGYSYWMVTQSVTCRFTHAWAALASFPDLLKYLCISIHHCWIMSISSFCHCHGDSIQDRLHGFCIKLWCDSPRGICSIVPSLLVFNAYGESCKWLYPTVSGII